MEITLIRHTRPLIEKGVCYGQTDLDVAETFLQEVALIQDQLSPMEWVISSPLKRCTILANELHHQVQVDPRIQEMNFGDWELMKWDEIPQDEIQPWYDDYVFTPTKNGESLDDVLRRVQSFLDDLKKSPFQHVTIVSHAGIIRSIISLIENRPPKDMFDIDVPYGSIHRLSFE